MMVSDDYQLMSRKEIGELRDTLKQMKDTGASPEKNSQILMANLQKTMLEMMVLYREAISEMKTEEGEQSLYKRIEEMQAKIDVLIDQNEKLAEGIVSLADMIKTEGQPRPGQQQFVQQQIPPMPEPMLNYNPGFTQQQHPPQPGYDPNFSPMPQPAGPMMGPAPSPPPPRPRQYPNFL
jgi:hypothetical protein